jgi:uncharacterized protein YaeQ
VFAYLIEYETGIEFSRGGLSEPDDPPLAIRDLTGAYRAWIEVGTPDAQRLHRASKASPRVSVYVHKDPSQWLARLAGERIYRADSLKIWALDRSLLDKMVTALGRRMTFSLAITDRELFVSTESANLLGNVSQLTLG